MDEIRLIRDPGAIRVVSEPTRRKILSLLRVKGMTASEIAGILEKDPSTVYRHLDKLQEAALVLPTGERKTHHIPEKVYTRTARVFLVAPDLSADVEGVDLGRLYGREEVARMLRVLQRMGHVQGGTRIWSLSFAGSSCGSTARSGGSWKQSGRRSPWRSTPSGAWRCSSSCSGSGGTRPSGPRWRRSWAAWSDHTAMAFHAPVWNRWPTTRDRR